MKGIKVPKSEALEIIAYECTWCHRAFRVRSFSRHCCEVKAQKTGLVMSGKPFPQKPEKPVKEPEENAVPF